MQITTITPVAPTGAPVPTLVDHDGSPVFAPCTSRWCPPDHAHLPPFPTVPAPPVLIDHDGTPVLPSHGGHGRA